MKLPFAFLLLATSAAFAADFPVYPGAVLDEQVTAHLRKNKPSAAAYNSNDAFEKVQDFYKKLGGVDMTHGGFKSDAEMKYAAMNFPGKHFAVQLSWNVHDKRHGTVIQLMTKP